MYKNKLLENNSRRHSIIAVMERALLETDFETKEHPELVKIFENIFLVEETTKKMSI